MLTTAILFDLDDTLVADDAATEAALLATCVQAQSRYGLDPQVFTRSLGRHARHLWQTSPTFSYCRAIGISSTEGLRARFGGDDPHLATLRAWAPLYRRTAWSRALVDHGVHDDTFAECLAATFIAERNARHMVFADVEPALRTLRSTCRLAVVTNGAPDLQREKLAGANLTWYFDAVIVSGEVGAGKPDPGPFALALDAVDVDPAEAVMVGDSLTRDIQGAWNAGLRSIWLNRAGSDGTGDGARPGAQIATLHHLLAVLSVDGPIDVQPL